MSGRIWCVLLLWGVGSLGAEIIHFSKLEKKKPPYSLKKNLFYPVRLISPEERSAMENRTPRDDSSRVQSREDPQKEIQRSISFEGYVEKNNRIHALISLNGEYFVVGEGEVFMETIKIVKIEEKRILLEVESRPIEIQLKGDSDE